MEYLHFTRLQPGKYKLDIGNVYDTYIYLYMYEYTHSSNFRLYLANSEHLKLKYTLDISFNPPFHGFITIQYTL